MSGAINVIYSFHHSPRGYPTFNTLTSVGAVRIRVPLPLMHISASCHTDKARAETHRDVHSDARDCSREQHTSPKAKELV